MQNAFLQSSLDDVGVQGRAGLMEKQGQASPMPQAVRDRLAQSRVGLHFPFRQLDLEPSMESVHHDLSVLLVRPPPPRAARGQGRPATAWPLSRPLTALVNPP